MVNIIDNILAFGEKNILIIIVLFLIIPPAWIWYKKISGGD